MLHLKKAFLSEASLVQLFPKPQRSVFLHLTTLSYLSDILFQVFKPSDTSENQPLCSVLLLEIPSAFSVFLTEP